MEQVTVKLRVRGVEEKRSDRWAICAEELGFTVYGNSLEEASEAFEGALVALVESFDRLSDLRDYLDNKCIPHWIERVSSSGHVRESTGHFDRPYEVPIGAPA